MRYTIKTSGLMCGHCDATVETALLNVVGVTEQLAAAVEAAGEKFHALSVTAA